MTTITTPRLSLTRFVTDDWPFFLRLRQDPLVMRFMGEVLSETALRSVFASRCADPGVFVLRDKRGDALGDIGLRISPKNPHEADVGYALLQQAQGRGYASEALRAICDYGFSTLGVQAINAWVLSENHGSSRLLEKQGFVRTQVLEKVYHLNGIDYDDWIYRLEREAHPTPTDAG
ncbi:GNAT family N-acetyltransferase [Klebsiella variicola]|uniref:GNAT family N-acetyltransferase n=1 Tax=Klebsiella variicola TaxID=244366 RepID=UPI000D750866|nr:GNAT family N-acetyltransferase [Klebsiella variicola]PXM11874.1 GNAT family N-acetyltransferase [Klebsiella variicola]